MSPLNKIKKKIVKKLCICKQKSNTFVSKNNCVCAASASGKKKSLRRKKKRARAVQVGKKKS